MTFLILIGNASRCFRFNDTEQLTSEIILHATVGTYPRSTEAAVVHHRMNASLQTLARVVISLNCIQSLRSQKSHLQGCSFR
jgi:hypothetical protein